MAPKKDFYLLHPLHSLEVADTEKWLASVVKNHKEIRDGYARLEEESDRKRLFLGEREVFTNVDAVVNSMHSEKTKAEFLHFLGLTSDKSDEEKETFKTQKVYRRRVHQDQENLNEVLANSKVRETLKSWSRDKRLQIGTPYFFVVGVLSTTSTSSYDISTHHNTNTKSRADFGAAAAAIATGGAGAAPCTTTQLEIEHDRSQEEDTSFIGTAPAPRKGRERIFAVEYRTFRYRFRRIARPTLGHGPQGEGVFANSTGATNVQKEAAELAAKLDEDDFDEVVDIGKEEPYFQLE